MKVPVRKGRRFFTVHFYPQTLTRWCFQTFFYFHPYLGKISNLIYFSNGLKPPPRLGWLRLEPLFQICHVNSASQKGHVFAELPGKYIHLDLI